MDRDNYQKGLSAWSSFLIGHLPGVTPSVTNQETRQVAKAN